MQLCDVAECATHLGEANVLEGCARCFVPSDVLHDAGGDQIRPVLVFLLCQQSPDSAGSVLNVARKAIVLKRYRRRSSSTLRFFYMLCGISPHISNLPLTLSLHSHPASPPKSIPLQTYLESSVRRMHPAGSVAFCMAVTYVTGVCTPHLWMSLTCVRK